MDAADEIECEIETLMLRLQTMDPDALLRLEQLWERFRRRVIVEKHLN